MKENNVASRPVVKLKFTTDFLEAVVQEGADETPRREEEGMLRTFVDTTAVGDNGGFCSWRTGMSYVKPFSKVSRDQNGRPRFTNARSFTKRSNVRKQEGQKTLGLQDAKDKGIDVYDLGRSKTRSQVRLALWAIHLKSPTAARAHALKHTKLKCGPAQSPATSDVFLSQ